jgi:hypothetical protein
MPAASDIYSGFGRGDKVLFFFPKTSKMIANSRIITNFSHCDTRQIFFSRNAVRLSKGHDNQEKSQQTRSAISFFRRPEKRRGCQNKKIKSLYVRQKPDIFQITTPLQWAQDKTATLVEQRSMYYLPVWIVT